MQVSNLKVFHEELAVDLVFFIKKKYYIMINTII
jgi:hypothetical protein